MKTKIIINRTGIFVYWRAKGGDYFYAPLNLVLKYGKRKIQYDIHLKELEAEYDYEMYNL